MFTKLDDPVKDSCQETKNFVIWQKNVGLQIFSMTSLKCGDSWENFGRQKNHLHHKWLPVDRIFFAKQTKFCEGGLSKMRTSSLIVSYSFCGVPAGFHSLTTVSREDKPFLFL